MYLTDSCRDSKYDRNVSFLYKSFKSTRKGSDLHNFINSISESYRILGICLRVSEASDNSSSPQMFEFPFCARLSVRCWGVVVKNSGWS